MIDTIYATKKSMSQAWDVNGKRLAITKLVVEPNIVVGDKQAQVRSDKKKVDGWTQTRILEVGYGNKKLARMSKPMRTRLEKLSLKNGVRQIAGVREQAGDEPIALGATINADKILQVGDIVQVQGTTKGRGFAGGMKRHGFRGGPKTHGQADRARAVGSVGNRTTPGRVWLGKRLPGHMGMTTKTVKGLVVAYFDSDSGEVWLTGPVPGTFGGVVAITTSGKKRKNFALNQEASGIEVKEEKKEAAAPASSEAQATPEVQEAPAQEAAPEEKPEKETK